MYRSFSQAFGWTPTQLDEMEIEMLFDYLIVSSMTNREDKPQKVYADQVGLF